MRGNEVVGATKGRHELARIPFADLPAALSDDRADELVLGHAAMVASTVAVACPFFCVAVVVFVVVIEVYIEIMFRFSQKLLQLRARGPGVTSGHSQHV